MPVWLIVIIVVALIGGAIGFFSSNDENRGEAAAGGAFMAATGCGYILLQIFLAGAGIFFIIWLFRLLF